MPTQFTRRSARLSTVRRTLCRRSKRALLAPYTGRDLSRLVRHRRLAATAATALVTFGVTNGTVCARPPVQLSDIAAGTGGFVINGIDPSDASGWSVSSAGDVNGDDLDDVIIGALQAAPGGDTFAGECYVVFGKVATTAVELSDVAAGIGGFVLNGIEPSDFAGWSVSGAGDVNGDGLDDVIIGASGAAPGGTFSEGQSYVVFGKASTTAVELSDIVAGTGGFVINGTDAGDVAGRSVSGAGDVNGDGLDDLIVGARGADPGSRMLAGETYVVFGKADTTAVALADVAAGSGGFVMNGINSTDESGQSVSGAGDVNGDGLDDLIVGAPGGDPNLTSAAGESYVVFGTASTTAVELSDVVAGTGGFVINGIDLLDRAGFSVSDAGDVNGDGLADVIVGSWFADPGGNTAAGQSYVVFGKATTTAVELTDVVAGTGGFAINGIDPDDFAGWSVSGAGDVNGDGLDDVIVGARDADPNGNSKAGESYVIFGRACTDPVDLADVAAGIGGFAIDGIDPDDESGGSVSGAGDVNGDGLDDLIVGAMRGDPGGDAGAGESYVIFGQVDLPDCPGDVTGAGGCPDGVVAFADLTQLLNSWGKCVSCDEDLDGDDIVGFTDLTTLLNNWGPCN